MTPNANGIAIIGMAGRFPKARDVEEYWKNLCLGVEGISFFSNEELEGIAVPKDKSRYVKARGIFEGADAFDAAFFGINPREAEIMDPQHRLFLESAWEALESATESLHKMVVSGDGLALDAVSHPHPALGPMSIYQWIAFVGAHEARHAAQIREIIPS